MRKTISYLAVITLLFAFLATPTSAIQYETTYLSPTVTYFEDGSYVVTVISEEMAENSASLLSVSKTKMATKDAHYYDSEHVLQFTVSVNATFSYDGRTSKAVRAAYKYHISSPNWQFISGDKQCEGATATATCSFRYMNRHYNTMSASISCAPDGTLS